MSVPIGRIEAASVVLVRGSVEVTTENKSKVRLAPNQLVDIKGNKTQVRKVDVSNTSVGRIIYCCFIKDP